MTPSLTSARPERAGSLYGLPQATIDKARAAGRDFESVLVGQFVETMFSGLGEDGPLGGGPGSSAWRSMLAEEIGKSVSASGGFGLADDITRALIEIQERRS